MGRTALVMASWLWGAFGKSQVRWGSLEAEWNCWAISTNYFILVLGSTDSRKEGGGDHLSSHQHRLRIRVGR